MFGIFICRHLLIFCSLPPSRFAQETLREPVGVVWVVSQFWEFESVRHLWLFMDEWCRRVWSVSWRGVVLVRDRKSVV